MESSECVYHPASVLPHTFTSELFTIFFVSFKEILLNLELLCLLNIHTAVSYLSPSRQK